MSHEHGAVRNSQVHSWDVKTYSDRQSLLLSCPCSLFPCYTFPNLVLRVSSAILGGVSWLDPKP